ncbi:UBX domain-containing protein 11 [Notolabrus celidotus]|uniref:UBX domain-containing protein 11 n=1 Tax=Notolabrus celidotus TaxID=1203425 RepID=UPI00148F87FA|nr:UBX domain-containing protein 11 [Notolabrus celidotus]
MSSPLSMLKKMKRTPLQGPLTDKGGRQKVPFRRNMFKEFQTQLTDDDGESSGQNLPPSSNTLNNPASTSKSKAPLKKGAPPTDFELMSAMMQRVTLLERTVRSQAQEIEQKSKRVSFLEEKVKLLKDSENTCDLRDDVERRCQQLQNQVCEMESFLNDYGLIWVGDENQPLNSERSLWQPDASEVRKFHMNFDIVLQRIRELNVVSGEGESFIQPTSTGAQLAKKDPIQLSLYSNGIVMFDGPFRSYQEQSTQECMQDLMDGYFPSELQDRFPDGVPFKVHDRRDEEFISRLPWNKFPGEGQAVLGDKDETSSVVSSKLPGKKLSMDQFLSKIPRVVLKAGRVIDVRDSLRRTLQGSSDARSSSVILVDTPALQAMRERLQTSGDDRPSSACEVLTLKVKSEDGNHTYVLKMSSSETIGNLRQYLDKHRGVHLNGYDIISVYPQCCYDEDSHTLQSCGLTINAALLLRNRRHPNSQTEVIK